MLKNDQLIECLENAARLLRERVSERDHYAPMNRDSAALACEIAVLLIKGGMAEACKQPANDVTCPSCERAKDALGGFFGPLFGNDIANGINAISTRCAGLEEALKEMKELAAGTQVRNPNDLLKQSAERMMRGEPPPADEQPYDIWVEGYSIQGEKGTACYLTTIVARSFREACLKANAAGALEGHGNFDEEHLTLWGAKLFPTESEARKNFG